MAKNDTDDDMRVRMPSTISVRDVFFVMSVVVSGIIAFGSLSGRTSILETQFNTIVRYIDDIKKRDERDEREEAQRRREKELHLKEQDRRFDELERDVDKLKSRIEYLERNRPRKR